MERSNSSRFLRLALAADAVATGVTALALFGLAKPLSSLFQLPAELLFGAGLSLVPFVAFVGGVARSQSPRPAAVWAVIACNLAWVAGSAALALSGAIAPNALGYAFVALQAVVAGAFAELELVGLRRARISASRLTGASASTARP
ncbi:MAG TPA: hypothetical protein VKF60_00765 [Myxococcota bacterium]|nr:hypothetical protein [Myxococcota bacterium]